MVNNTGMVRKGRKERTGRKEQGERISGKGRKGVIKGSEERERAARRGERAGRKRRWEMGGRIEDVGMGRGIKK